MTHYMDTHRDMKGITAEQLREAHAADVAIQADEGVVFERAWADPDSGVVYCLSDAPNEQAVRRIHERTGHPAHEVVRVPLEV